MRGHWKIFYLNKIIQRQRIIWLVLLAKNIIDPLMVINSQIIKTFPLLGGDWLYF